MWQVTKTQELLLRVMWGAEASASAPAMAPMPMAARPPKGSIGMKTR